MQVPFNEIGIENLRIILLLRDNVLKRVLVFCFDFYFIFDISFYEKTFIYFDN